MSVAIWSLRERPARNFPQRGSGSLNEAAHLKRRVHVLIVHAGNENSRRDISVEPRQRGVHIRALPIVQQADAVAHPRALPTAIHRVGQQKSKWVDTLSAAST